MSTLAQAFEHASAHFEAGDYLQAEQRAWAVVSAEDNHSEAWRLLGRIALLRNDRAQSLGFLNKSLVANHANDKTWLDLADYYLTIGDTAKAIAHCEHVVKLSPENSEAYSRLATIYQRVGKPRKSIESLEHAARLRPESAEFAFRLGAALQDVGETERAIEQYRRALQVDASHADANARLGSALAEIGEIAEAVVRCRESLRVRPLQATLLYYLTQMAGEGWCTLTESEVDTLQMIVADERFRPKDRNQCAYGLAAILHREGSYDRAFEYYRLANNLQKRHLRDSRIRFDPLGHEASVSRIIASYDSAYFERVREWGDPNARPIFIVGMPRSGSTLVEQTLANHPQVHAAGEVADVLQLAVAFLSKGAAHPDWPPMLPDQTAAQALAKEYLRWMDDLGRGATHVTNKMLHNLFALGLIATMFPRARIIHCRRETIDVCLSCYFTSFRQTEFSCSLDDIGVYYRNYDRLMKHWAKVLPTPIHEIRYEEFVADPERGTRGLLDACELEWHAGCLEFYKARRAVRTASLLQVRRPISTKAIGRWRHYRTHLRPLFRALGLPASGPDDDRSTS